VAPSPYRTPEESSAGPRSPAHALDLDESSAGRAIILVVEKDPHVRELESYFLNEAGYAVEFASDGVAAFASALRVRPAIIITEVLVPKMDGLALCRAVKAEPALRHTVVLVFSILAVHSRARDAGADAFLMKPLAEKRLVDTVRELLALRGRAAPTGDAT
jgi:two-component system response regulator MprA